MVSRHLRKVTYYIKPLGKDYTSYHPAVWPFNCKPSPLKLGHNGYSSFTLENVPAFHEEPYMLAKPNVRPWALLFYRSDEKRDPDKYWSEIGRKWYDRMKQSLKSNDEVQVAATQAVAGANTPEDKVADPMLLGFSYG